MTRPTFPSRRVRRIFCSLSRDRCRFVLSVLGVKRATERWQKPLGRRRQSPTVKRHFSPTVQCSRSSQPQRCASCKMCSVLGVGGGHPQSLALRVLGDRHSGYRCPRLANVTLAKFPERDLLLLTLSLSPHLLLRLALALA